MKLLQIVLISFFISCQSDQHETSHTEKGSLKQHQFAKLNTDAGIIKIRFLPKKAPLTVKRIKELINSNFYNGVQFHRVIPNFVAQAGDPTGTGVGGSGKKIKAEFNDEIHVKGTIAMARLSHDENSADSQFYIALSTLPHLDKKYTVFARVVEGLDVIEKIKKGDQIKSFTLVE